MSERQSQFFQFLLFGFATENFALQDPSKSTLLVQFCNRNIGSTSEAHVSGVKFEKF